MVGKEDVCKTFLLGFGIFSGANWLLNFQGVFRLNYQPSKMGTVHRPSLGVKIPNEPDQNCLWWYCWWLRPGSLSYCSSVVFPTIFQGSSKVISTLRSHEYWTDIWDDRDQWLGSPSSYSQYLQSHVFQVGHDNFSGTKNSGPKSRKKPVELAASSKGDFWFESQDFD